MHALHGAGIVVLLCVLLELVQVVLGLAFVVDVLERY